VSAVELQVPAWRADRSWRASAACLGHGDPDLFFPDPGYAGGLDEARAVCAGCPVRYTCLEYALDNAIHDGVWGGMSAWERRDRSRGRAEARRRERDAAIVAAAEAGHSHGEIAASVGLTRPRVTAIVTAAVRGAA
jgi:WhiB family transcriptional regulator, redox-sensing transcriptional regulator